MRNASCLLALSLLLCRKGYNMVLLALWCNLYVSLNLVQICRSAANLIFLDKHCTNL